MVYNNVLNERSILVLTACNFVLNILDFFSQTRSIHPEPEPDELFNTMILLLLCFTVDGKAVKF